MILHKFCSNIVWYNVSRWRATILSPFNSLLYLPTVVWKSASDLFLLACATNFMASISVPLYFSASFPLTILWTSSGLKYKNMKNN